VRTTGEDGGDDTGAGRRRPGLPAGLDGGLRFDPGWCLVVEDDGVDGDLARVAESWFCVADGTVGTRGVLEDGHDPQSPVVVAAGLYEPADGVGEALVPLPSWCTLPVVQSLPAGRRVLDLRDGVLTRVTDAGDRTLRTARFACPNDPVPVCWWPRRTPGS
jgi:trehalose/maltose hydrolase-like predicted phosphorylase